MKIANRRKRVNRVIILINMLSNYKSHVNRKKDFMISTLILATANKKAFHY